MKPEIATILEDGTYGQREMTDEEFAHYEATIADNEPEPDAE
jgi:hypothetical protein